MSATTTTMSTIQHALTKQVIPAKTCVGLLHKGPYHEIGDTFKAFFQQLNKSNSDGCGASTHHGKVLGLYLDNPQTTPAADLRSYAAMEIENAAADDDDKNEWPNNWQTIQVNGGPAAVLTVKGSYHQLAAAWQTFGARVTAQGWTLSTHPDHIPQEVYLEMDPQDESKNVTQLVMFLQDE